MGHPYYFNVLKGYKKLISQEPMFIEDSFSTPIWFDKTLKTRLAWRQSTPPN